MNSSNSAATPSESTCETLAARLRNAYKTLLPCEPLRGELPPGDVASAYRVQSINTQHWKAQGRRAVGAKIGLTSPAVQRQLGVDQPDFGVLFADMKCPDGGTLRRSEMHQPKLEAEVAFLMGRDLPTPDLTTLRAAIDCALVAIEIPDSRIARWDIGIVDTIADNASSGRFVLGTLRVPLTDVDLVGCAMTLECDGAVVSTGSGAACLGSPLNSALWLAKRLALHGESLRAGDIVLSGALGPMVAAQPGATYRAQVTGLGSVSVHFEG